MDPAAPARSRFLSAARTAVVRATTARPVIAWASGYAFLAGSLRHLGIPLGAAAVGLALAAILYWAIDSLAHVRALPESRTPRIRLVADPVAGAPVPPTTSRPVRVYGAAGERTVWMRGVGERPSVPGRGALRFASVLALTFALLSVPLIVFYPVIFAQYDRIVALVGSLLYWPLPWPGVYAVSASTLLVPDFIFPMYLALMASFALASGLVLNRPRYSARRRGRALAVVSLYVVAELLVDALFFTVPGETLRDFALILRMFTGGLFMALLTFCAFHLPAPIAVTPRFPRDRRAIATFLGLASAAVVLSGAALIGVTDLLGTRGIVTQFTILLLLPVLALPVFCALARPVYFRSVRRRRLPPLSQYHPFVSILVPAYNEEENIRDCLRSADRAAGAYPGRVEVIVGSDGSTDRTVELARQEIAGFQHATGLVADLPHGGKSNALNGALALARGEIVLRLDGDTVISDDHGFAPMIPHFADPEVGGVQGAIHPRQRSGWTRKLRGLEVAWLHYMLRPAGIATRSAEVLDGLFSAFRRSDLVALGGWVPWNGEDSEMSMRIQRLGYRIRIEFAALALEDVPGDYASLRKQRVRWSRGIVMANGQHYPSLLGPTPEFTGLGVLFWFLLLIRSGVRSLVYVFLLLLILVLGVPGLVDAAILLALATLVRAVPLGYYLLRMGRADLLAWIPFFPIASLLKQNFRFEAFGTLGPGASAEYS